VAVGAFLGSTLLQSRADASALLGGLRYWTSRSGGRSVRSVRLELDGDALELSQGSTPDQERLIELFVKRHLTSDTEQHTTPAVQAENASKPVPSPPVLAAAEGKTLTVIEGEPARLVIRLVVTLIVLAIAVTAILAKTSAEPAWGAIGAVVGYWLR
jgi:hypothetical protein